MKKVLIAMSHALTQAQIQDLTSSGFEAIVSQKFIELGCNRLAPTLTSGEVEEIANKIVDGAIMSDCQAIAMTGEPMLTFHVWNNAKIAGLTVLQSTTERKTTEVTNQDGTVTKTQIFAHVQWRQL